MQQGWDIYLSGEKLCGKGPGASGELHMSEQGVVTAKKPTGSWVASKSASAAEIKKKKSVNRLERVRGSREVPKLLSED